MAAFAAMTGTTSTGSSTTFLKQLELEQSGLPLKDATNELIKRLIKNVVEIKDTTGEFLLHLPGGKIVDTKGWFALSPCFCSGALEFTLSIYQLQGQLGVDARSVVQSSRFRPSLR